MKHQVLEQQAHSEKIAMPIAVEKTEAKDSQSYKYQGDLEQLKDTLEGKKNIFNQKQQWEDRQKMKTVGANQKDPAAEMNDQYKQWSI